MLLNVINFICLTWLSFYTCREATEIANHDIAKVSIYIYVQLSISYTSEWVWYPCYWCSGGRVLITRIPYEWMEYNLFIFHTKNQCLLVFVSSRCFIWCLSIKLCSCCTCMYGHKILIINGIWLYCIAVS